MSGLLAPDARQRILSALSVVVPGAKLHTYVSGTPSTPLTTYNNADLAPGHENTNPIVADAGGLFGPIYLTRSVAYKFVLADASDVEIWSQDPVTADAIDASALTNHGVLLGTGAVTLGVTAVGATGTALGGVTGADPTFKTVPTILGVQAANLVLAGPTSGAAALATFRALTGADLTAANGVRVLARANVLVDVANSAVETIVFTTSVPAGTLGTTKQLRFFLYGDFLNNSGGNTQLTVRVKYGATTILSATHGALGTSADRRGYFLAAVLTAKNATNAQVAQGTSSHGNVGPTNAGVMAQLVAAQLFGGTNIAIAEDSTLAKDFVVTFQHDTAAVTVSAKAYVSVLEVEE